MLERPIIEHDKPKGVFEEMIDTFKNLSWYASFPLYLAMLIFSWILLIYLTPGVLDWGGSGGYGWVSISMIPSVFWIIEGAYFQLWFMIVISIVTMAILYSLYGVIKDIKGSRLGPYIKDIGDLDLISRFFFASLFFKFGFFMLLDLAGISPTTPDFDSWPIEQLVFGLVNASVNEELVSRVMLIGIPLMIMHTWNIGPRMIRSREKSEFRAKCKLLLGGNIPINHLSIILIIFSSIVFAAAHIDSWDIYKFLPTLVSGMMLGYLYVKRGLFTSILFHFSTNFIFFSAQLWEGDLTILIIGLTMLLWMVVGGYHMVMIIRAIMDYLKKAITRNIPGIG